MCWWDVKPYSINQSINQYVWVETPIGCDTCCAPHWDIYLSSLKSVSLPYPFLTCNVFAADMVRHAVILTSDSLTLNVYNVSADHVLKLCTKFERNRTIGDGVIAIYIMSNLNAVRHLEFDRKWPPGTHNALAYFNTVLSNFMLTSVPTSKSADIVWPEKLKP